MNTYNLPDPHTDPVAFFDAAKRFARVLGPWMLVGGEPSRRIDETSMYVGSRPEWIRKNPSGWTSVQYQTPPGPPEWAIDSTYLFRWQALRHVARSLWTLDRLHGGGGS
jgi:hypothetical protein